MQTSLLKSGRGEVRAPRIFSLPEEFEAENSKARAEEMIDLAQLAGLTLDPWQEFATEGMTRMRADGKWSATEVALLANRQNGKGSIMEARQLAGLFLWGETLQAHTSHEFRTSQKHFERILSLIEGTPALDSMVQKVKLADGEESIITKDGMTLQFMARSLKSGRGITGNVVYFDEAFALKPQMVASLMSTLSARSVTGNPQIVYASSAGMPESETLWNLRESGVAGDNARLAYMEWSAPDDADPDDPEVWAASNPAFGIRISEDFVRSERSRMGDEEFKRERLGIWAKLGNESVFASGVWSDLADPESAPGERLVFGVEIAGNRESASIALLSFRDDELVHAEITDNEVGTSWIGHRLGELQRKWKPAAIVAIAGGHVDSMLPEWKREGVKVRLIRFPDYVKACGLVFDKVTQGKIRHLGDPILSSAVEGVVQQFTRDNAAWYWSRKGSDVDITPLVALTVGIAGLEDKKVRGRPAGERRRAAIL